MPKQQSSPSSSSPSFATPKTSKTTTTSSSLPVPKRRRRPDGRAGGGTLRPLSCELSCLHRADGSAKLSSGSTLILAAVHGPALPRTPSRERMGGATVSVVFKHGTKGGAGGGGTTTATTTGRGGGGGGTTTALPPGYGATERELERFIADAVSSCVLLSAYPRAIIEIVIQVIKADGSILGTALNTAVLALLDAGVVMRSLPVGTTCLVGPFFRRENNSDADRNDGSADSLRLDPTSEEEELIQTTDDSGYAVVVLVTDSTQPNGVVTAVTFGSLTLESFLSCVEAASRASQAVVAFMRLAVEQKVTREAQTLWST